MTKQLLARIALVAAMLAAAALPAAAQSGRIATDPMTIPELKPEFDRARTLAINPDMLVAKARQGFVNAASTSTVRGALRSYTDRLVAAREALKPVVNDAELEAGASALMANVPASVLRNLRQVQRTRSLAMPIGVLQSLVEVRGVSVKSASETVLALVKKQASDVQIAQLGLNVQADVAAGLAPSVAMEVRLKGVLSLPQGAVQGAALGANRPPPR